MDTNSRSGARVLIVDDEPAITVSLAKKLRREGYECLTANSGEEALELLASGPLDIVVSDVRMPGMSGLDLLKAIKSHDSDTQVIMMTAYTDITLAIEALRNKADDYLLKPFNLAELSHSVARSLEHRRLLREVQAFRTSMWFERSETGAAAERDFQESLAVLAVALERRDRHTRGHLRQVSRYARAVGAELGLSAESLQALWLGAVLHDVGMIVVPEEVINRAGPLTPDEWRSVHRHPAAGAGMIEAAARLRPAREAILHHHERWDGSGYPSGLKGSDISRHGAIVAVADSFAAMLSDRPYRGALSEAAAVAEIEGGADTRFDPQVVEAFQRARAKGFPVPELEPSVPDSIG